MLLVTDEPDLTDDRDIRLGSLALKKGLVSAAQLREALAEQAREATQGKMPRQLGLILLGMNAITEPQLMALLAEQQKLKSRLSET
jgi:hypothetical protein